MSSFTNQSKQSAASFTNTAKNTGSIINAIKGGQGYPYDSYLTYDEALDPLTGNPVYYDSIGLTPSITNLPKS